MILSSHLFCLLNLSTTPQLCPPLLLAYTFDVLDLIRQHNQLNTIRYLLCMIYYALYAMHYTLCTMYYTLHYLLCTMYYALCTIHYVLCTIYYALCIIYYTLCTMYYALFTMHYILYTMHTYLYVFICIYYFRRIPMYSLFHVEIRRNPVISVATRNSRHVE